MKICKKMLCVVLTLIICFGMVSVAGIAFEAEAATQILYRFRTKEWLYSDSKSEEGYTLYSSKWAEEPSESKIVTYAKAWPSGSSTTKGFKTNNSLYKKYQRPATGETETTKTVLGDESKAKTVGYLYWHWCYTHDSDDILDCVIKDSNSGKVKKYINGKESGYYYTTNFHAFYSTSALTFNSNALAYKKSSASNCKYTFWWNGLTYGKKGNIEVVSNTLYTYEKVYNHYKWSDWSEWSTTPAEASEDVEVETWEVSVNLCGDNAYWEFDESTGTLTISGYGPTYNYRAYGTDLEDVRSPFDNNNGIKRVIIEDGITSIGDYLLFGCCNIEDIQIPETVTYIGVRAVDGKFTQFHIGKNVEHVDGTIEELECVEKFTVDIENEYYSADEFGCLYSKDKIWLEAYPASNEATEFEIPENVKFVSAGFDCANNLETAYIGENVMSLSDGAFTSAFNLKNIVVDENNKDYFNDEYGALYSSHPDNANGIILKCYPTGNTRSVFEIADGTNTIWHSVFNGDTKINTLIIPVSVTSMIWGALMCQNLSDIYYYGTEEQWNQIDIDEFNNTDLEDVTIHFNYKKDDIIITKSGYCGEDVTYELTSDGTLIISGTGPMFDYSWEDNNGNGMPPYMTWEYEEIDGEMCIVGDETIRKVIIGDGVTTIGDYAFNACTALENVEIGSAVTSVGAVSFDYCINLKEVTLPDSVTIIKEEAFSESGLEKITLSKNLETIEQIAFLLCENLKEVVVPESVTSIGMVAFAMCPSLETLTILNKDCELDNTFIINAIIDEESGEMIPVELETVLIGYTDSTAQQYAEMYTSAGYPIKFEAIDAHEHTPVAETKKENCTEDGYVIITCANCGELISHEVIYAHGHSFEVKQVISPTCTEKGFTLYECTNSGCYQEKTDNYTDALGHSYTQKIIDNAHLVSEATYDKAAVYKYDCSRCSSIGSETFEYGEKLVKDEANKNCSCNCHKGGIAGFFFKLILFFQKIFGSNKVCSCGVNHY